MTEDGKVLRKKLDDFQIEQLTKFFNVRYKHPNDDVCDNNTDWSKYDLWKVLDHLMEEIIEVCNLLYINAPDPKNTEKIDFKQLRMECVDVANLAFILGEVAKELQIKRMVASLPDDFDPDPLRR
jgi:hypothetical protein